MFLLSVRIGCHFPGEKQHIQTHRRITMAIVINYLSGPVLRDTARLSQRYPPIARYGVFGVSIWPIGCDTPPPFSDRVPIGEHAKWRCDTPQKRYLSDTCAIPFANQGKWVRYPPLRYYLEKVLRDMGGISHWAAKITIDRVIQERKRHININNFVG